MTRVENSASEIETVWSDGLDVLSELVALSLSAAKGEGAVRIPGAFLRRASGWMTAVYGEWGEFRDCVRSGGGSVGARLALPGGKAGGWAPGAACVTDGDLPRLILPIESISAAGYCQRPRGTAA